VRVAPLFNLFEMPLEPGEDFLALAISELARDLAQRKVNDVVVVQLFRGNVAAQLEPDVVQEVDFLGGKLWGVRAQEKKMLFAAGPANNEG